MGHDVYANNMLITAKCADGKSIAAFPDVCMTPPPPPGVPVPYPNTSFASDLTDGSKTVKIAGTEVCLKDKSNFKTSTGDEAGCAPKHGVVTGKIKGKTFFTSWSMNVKVEGLNVTRHLDLTTHNHGSQPGNTPPWPQIDKMTAPPLKKEEKGNLTVNVVNRCDGKPVKGAEVYVNGEFKETGGSGEAKFSGLPVQGYNVRVRKEFPECDFVTFIVHYPRVLRSHQAISKGSETIDVNDGKTTELKIEIEVFRLVERIVFHRKHIDLGKEDKYGHWWAVLDNNLSFGWWPKYRLGDWRNHVSEAPEPPKALAKSASGLDKIQYAFSRAVFEVHYKMWGLREGSLGQTLAGVEGQLNGLELGGSTTQDPHHLNGDVGDEQYQPVIHNCLTDHEIRECLKSFALNYTGEWSWRFEAGNHCHSFQKKMMEHGQLTEFKRLK